MMAIKAIFPGTFDPITNGHLDLIRRAARLFQHVIVAVASGAHKKPHWSLAERLNFVAESVSELNNVSCCPFDGLLVDLLEPHQAQVIIRGVRNATDFEFESQLTRMNTYLKPACETIYLLPNQKYQFLSSSLIREVARMGGDVSQLVPSIVLEALNKKV